MNKKEKGKLDLTENIFNVLDSIKNAKHTPNNVCYILSLCIRIACEAKDIKEERKSKQLIKHVRNYISHKHHGKDTIQIRCEEHSIIVELQEFLLFKNEEIIKHLYKYSSSFQERSCLLLLLFCLFQYTYTYYHSYHTLWA